MASDRWALVPHELLLPIICINYILLFLHIDIGLRFLLAYSNDKKAEHVHCVHVYWKLNLTNPVLFQIYITYKPKVKSGEKRTYASTCSFWDFGLGGVVCSFIPSYLSRASLSGCTIVSSICGNNCNKKKQVMSQEMSRWHCNVTSKEKQEMSQWHCNVTSQEKQDMSRWNYNVTSQEKTRYDTMTSQEKQEMSPWHCNIISQEKN